MFGNTPPRTLFGTLTDPPRDASSEVKDSITFEVVETVNADGTYTVAGSVIGTSGFQPSIRAGDSVPVARVGGVPTVILAHAARRAQLHSRGPQQLGGVVEELFLATDPQTSQTDLYFRNWSVVTPLKIKSFAALTGRTLSQVKWGPDGNRFGVLTTDIKIISVGPIVTQSTNIVHVFKINRASGTILGQNVKPTIVYVASYTVETNATGLYPAITFEAEAVYNAGTGSLISSNCGGTTPAITPQTMNAIAKTGTVTHTFTTPFGDVPVTVTDQNVVRVLFTNWILDQNGDVLASFQLRATWGTTNFYASTVANLGKNTVILPATFDGSNVLTGHRATAIPGATGFSGVYPFPGPTVTFDVGLYWCQAESVDAKNAALIVAASNVMTFTLLVAPSGTTTLTNRTFAAAVMRAASTTSLVPDGPDTHVAVNVQLTGSGLGYFLNLHRTLWVPLATLGLSNGFAAGAGSWSMTDYASGETKVVATNAAEFYSRLFALFDPNMMYYTREPQTPTDKTHFFVNGWNGTDGAITLNQASPGYPVEDTSLSAVKALAKLPTGVTRPASSSFGFSDDFHAVNDSNLLGGRA